MVCRLDEISKSKSRQVYSGWTFQKVQESKWCVGCGGCCRFDWKNKPWVNDYNLVQSSGELNNFRDDPAKRLCAGVNF